ncbi:hypothetical protein F503_05873 [Ophiostoma piceae UAMH 11346]|uniref:Uncharacterized protein n=1 Tax=Ophiostoma piceae (strain UAMH 11346) TaxID=1262450 RepID=S3CVQ7_OPHP1|nr:hypothetical protein F503_05873 [Ophiostoma piceae UAMH 11346]
MAQPLFGIVPAGLPVITAPTEAPSPTSFLYSIQAPPADQRTFSHVVVFLLPGVELPQGTAAAIYLVTPPTTPGQTTPQSRFLGGIGPGKESAIFKIGGGQQSAPTVLGISVEDASSVGARVEEVRSSSKAVVLSGSSAGANSSSSTQPSTLVLAQRIIQNAFNFLVGFSGSSGTGGPEVVPLKAFEEWWRKFEGRVRSDPTFLERSAE